MLHPQKNETDASACNLVKDNPKNPIDRGRDQRVLNLPGYRLAFTVGIGRQVHGIGALRRILQFTNGLRSAFHQLVLRGKVIIYRDPQLALGQVV